MKYFYGTGFSMLNAGKSVNPTVNSSGKPKLWNIIVRGAKIPKT